MFAFVCFEFFSSASTTLGATSGSASSTWICLPSAGRIQALCWVHECYPFALAFNGLFSFELFWYSHDDEAVFPLLSRTCINNNSYGKLLNLDIVIELKY